MRSKRAKHSKLRNTGLLFEFLLRQITADVLNKKDTSKAVQIVKKRFNENTELGKELSLYNILANKKFTSDKKAEFFISEVVDVRNKLNNNRLKREKYNLIKEIKEYYNLQKFLSSKVPNYKVFATAYKLFEHKNVISPEDKTEAYFNLIETITTNENDIKLSNINTKLPNDEDLRLITYRTLLEKFNQKYSKLNLAQKSLLRAYINNVSNTNSLVEYFKKVTPKLKKEIKQKTSKINDKVVKIKLKEAVISMDKFCGLKSKSRMVKDSAVVQMMRYMELLKELKKVGK